MTRLPFVAPGRRKLFLDSFAEYQRLLRERPRCLPASDEAPEGRLFSLSAALALAALRRVAEADDRLALPWEWRDDPRYAVASAYAGLARPDLDRALEALHDPARDAVDKDAQPGGDDPALAQVAEQCYYVLLAMGIPIAPL